MLGNLFQLLLPHFPALPEKTACPTRARLHCPPSPHQGSASNPTAALPGQLATDWNRARSSGKEKLEQAKRARRTTGLLLRREDEDSRERQQADVKPSRRQTPSSSCARQLVEGIKISQSFYMLRTLYIKLVLRQTGSKIEINPNHSSSLYHLCFQKAGFLFKLKFATFQSVELA